MTTYPDVQDLSRFRVPDGFRQRSAVVVILWWLVRDTLFRGSPQPLYGFRRWLLRLFGAKIGNYVLIRSTARVTYPWMLEIGDYAQVGDFAELYTLDRITIGAHAVVSQFSHLCTGSHDHRSVSFDIFAKPIVIEPQAWVAANTFVGPGVTVGFGAVISAQSRLMTDAPALKILTGNPAVVIGDRTPQAAQA